MPAVIATMESTQFILGKAVEDFEKRFADAHGMKHCIAVGSGTDALHLILWAKGVGPGDEVITVPHTFIATAEAISITGARPVFVDIDPVTYTMDPACSRQRSRSARRRSSPSISTASRRRWTGSWKSQAGTGSWWLRMRARPTWRNGRESRSGSSASARPSASIPARTSARTARRAASPRTMMHLRWRFASFGTTVSSKKYHHQRWGHNYRMDGIQGAVLGVKLPHLEAWTEARRRHAAEYGRRLRGVGDLIVPEEESGCTACVSSVRRPDEIP